MHPATHTIRPYVSSVRPPMASLKNEAVFRSGRWRLASPPADFRRRHDGSMMFPPACRCQRGSGLCQQAHVGQDARRGTGLRGGQIDRNPAITASTIKSIRGCPGVTTRDCCRGWLGNGRLIMNPP